MTADSDADVLRYSGLLDDEHYRAHADLSESTDAALHYVTSGWRQGLEPNPRFDGKFLGPFYAAAGLADQPPALVWFEHSTSTNPLPTRRDEAEVLADRLRTSSVFDAAFYSAQLPEDIDPALHYVVIGERIGWRPSPLFDGVYYSERYPDIPQTGVSPWQHFERFGKAEGRQTRSVADRLTFAPLPRSDRPVILVISHETSRTGAPILGWNIARLLAQRATIVSLMMRGGDLQDAFTGIANVSIGPLTWEDWNAADAWRLAKRIAHDYKPVYAIANGIETNIMVPALAMHGIPSVALVHEFAAYTRPLAKMRNIYDWASHVVFPARIVAQSSYDNFTGLQKRPGLHILAQGQNDPPPAEDRDRIQPANDDLYQRMRPDGDENLFVVLGAGTVQIRKGVDLFIGIAAAAKRLRPQVRFRFVWIGEGYDPKHDDGYSVYLAYQISQSGLDESLEILDATPSLEGAYAATDAFLLSSRLDPQPNVGIDTVIRGIPTICFEGACGTAEILFADPATRELVVPHLDVHAAAIVLCNLADDRAKTAALGADVARVGRESYDMGAYVDQIDRWGHSAAADLHKEDLATLAESGAVDPEMAVSRHARPGDLLSVERQVLHLWSVVGLSADTTVNPQFRRPCTGFNPQIYAHAHLEACGSGQANPLAHWLRAGRPGGRWSREVFRPGHDGLPALPVATYRVALHAHFYFEALAPDLATRLARNALQCDLFLTTDTEAKAAYLSDIFANHRGAVEVMVTPNRGRDIGPFLTQLHNRLGGGSYDMIGHVHAKRSLDTNATMGDEWRDFLWENLIGGKHSMLDLAASVLASRPTVGLIIAEDPHLVGWNDNREIAERLAKRMGIPTPLANFFDFPLGAMFWCRPEALRSLYQLNLRWNDYPVEPVPYDGTILHAIERLIPFVAEHAGFDTAGMRVPGSNWSEEATTDQSLETATDPLALAAQILEQKNEIEALSAHHSRSIFELEAHNARVVFELEAHHDRIRAKLDGEHNGALEELRKRNEDLSDNLSAAEARLQSLGDELTVRGLTLAPMDLTPTHEERARDVLLGYLNSSSWKLTRPLRRLSNLLGWRPDRDISDNIPSSPEECVRLIRQIQRSASWRLTKPIRLIGSILRGRG